ncbi:hypothetical protein MHK_002659, partial [Candidatus Magnetomorum sp. HK-1]
MYIVDSENHRIQKFTDDGGFITRWGTGDGNGEFNSPRGIALDNEDYVYVADCNNNRIQKFRSDGEFIAKWTYQYEQQKKQEIIQVLLSPTRIAINSKNEIYVSDENHHSIVIFDTNGNFKKELRYEGVMMTPNGIAFDKSDNLFIANTEGNNILKIDKNYE